MAKRIMIVLLALAVIPVLPSGASDPSSGTVSAAVSKLAYKGEAGIGTPQSAGSENGCVEGVNCDTFELTVDVPDGFYSKNARTLTATIKWADKANDLNLYLCAGTQTDDPQCLSGAIASSAGDGTVETLTVKNPEPGVYRVMTKASTGASSYDGVVTFLAPATAASKTAKPIINSASNGFSWYTHPVTADSAFAEPSIDVDHYGAIYITAPGGAGVQMWRSYDNGQTFVHKEIVSPSGGSDSEIEILSNDVVLTADLEITDSAISRSDDRLETFTQQPVGIEQDRQWLAHRCSNVVLFAYHDFVLEAEMVNRSTDGGVTWETVPVFISPSQSAPGSGPNMADQGVNTFSGPIVMDQKTGDAYIIFAISSATGNVLTGVPPFGEPEQMVVGVSHDEGQTWTLKLLKSGGPGALAGEIWPWITLDRAGNVYASWAGRDSESEPLNVFMTYSTDHGENWGKPYRVNQDATGHAHIYTTISGGDPGVVDIAWYTSTKPDPADAANDWFVDFAQVRNAASQSPNITQSRIMPKPIHHGEVCLLGILCGTPGQPSDRSLLDFFQVQVGPDGMANIAFANNGTPDDTLRVWYAKQTGGRSAGSALHDSTYCAKAAGGPGPLPKPVIPPIPKPVPKPPKVLGSHLAGTGVGSYQLLAWVLLAAAVAAGARFRVWRRVA